MIPQEIRQKMFLYFPCTAIHIGLCEKSIKELNKLPHTAQNYIFLINSRKIILVL
jgi:hypothetical protein